MTAYCGQNCLCAAGSEDPTVRQGVSGHRRNTPAIALAASASVKPEIPAKMTSGQSPGAMGETSKREAMLGVYRIRNNNANCDITAIARYLLLMMPSRKMV